MQAVLADSDFDLRWGGEVFRTVRARDLWQKIISNAHASAEPGIIFWDTMREYHNVEYANPLTSTNPCGEQPLPPYGACLLGSVNLARLIAEPFTDKARIDENELRNVVATAVRMMDNTIDISRFPLPAQQQEAKAWIPILF